jgi:rhamnose utilization protein RhaD (predicted bifunctional aldolase and dehydrogenase)/NAD(P)-dependent dehydrogenase (short-subunit alcohol dehydrogenase family)
MKNRWTQDGARGAIQQWSSHGEDFALRLYTARLIGQEPDLVLHGGGNVSLKGSIKNRLGDSVEVIHVKASGADMSTLEPAGLPALDLAYLRRLVNLPELDDDTMVGELRTHLLDADAPTPSIETLVHAALSARYVDHSHADAVLILTNQPHGEQLIREVLGDRVTILPYIRPGFDLAKAVAKAHAANPKVDGIVLLQHGLFTFADGARTSYDRHIDLVTRCEQFIEQRTAGRMPAAVRSTDQQPAVNVALAAPILRGLLASPTGDEDQPHRRCLLDWRATPEILGILGSPNANVLAGCGPLTADHLIRTKPWPMFVEAPQWSDPPAFREQLLAAVDDYRSRYESYASGIASPLTKGGYRGVDSGPLVVWLPGAGLLCWGRSKRDARIAADIAEHTLIALTKAHAIGSFVSLSLQHLHDMEFRGLQRVKLDNPPLSPLSKGGCFIASPLTKGGSRGVFSEQPLEGQVVAISGAAGAIGSAIAEVCAEAGAHVALTDLDGRRLMPVVQRIEKRHGAGAAIALLLDVTDEASVRRGFDQITRTYGGVDVLVPNAGVAHVAPIDELTAADFRRVMDVNATGYLLFMREGVRILKAQGLGGHIVVISSKNVLSPGKDFAAYSASKAAAHQLGRLAAIELAPFGIRVNMLTPDAVFGDEQTPSGLWKAVSPQRARTHDLKAEDLPEYYRRRNLLQARVYGRHVGNAVVFFASNATPTTGATLPIDGGLPDAFPR